MKSWFAKLRGCGLAVQSALLDLCVLAAYGLVAPIAHWRGGLAGMVAAGVAAALCWLGAQTALVLARRFQGPDDAWKGMLLGMLPRMGIPFVLGVVGQLSSATLAEAGLLVYLVVFYPVTLWAETIVCLLARDGAAGPGQISRNVAL